MAEINNQLNSGSQDGEPLKPNPVELLTRTGILLFLALVLHVVSVVSYAWGTADSAEGMDELITYPLLLAPFTMPGAFGLTVRNLLAWMPMKAGELISVLCFVAFWPLVIFYCLRWVPRARLLYLAALIVIGLLTAVNWHVLSIAGMHV